MQERTARHGSSNRPATTPLAAPQYGHVYMKNGQKGTGREAGPLLPQSSAIREEFTFQLPH